MPSHACEDLSKEDFESWISVGGEGFVDIPSGETHVDIVRFQVPEDAPKGCVSRFYLNVSYIEDEEETLYTSEMFDVVVI